MTQPCAFCQRPKERGIPFVVSTADYVTERRIRDLQDLPDVVALHMHFCSMACIWKWLEFRMFGRLHDIKVEPCVVCINSRALELGDGARQLVEDLIAEMPAAVLDGIACWNCFGTGFVHDLDPKEKFNRISALLPDELRPKKHS